jgi:ankyrin repeat protein
MNGLKTYPEQLHHRSDNGWTPFMMFICNYYAHPLYVEALKELLQYPECNFEDANVLINAAIYTNASNVETLLQLGAPIDKLDSNNNTCLQVVLNSQYVNWVNWDIVNVLLKYNANVNVHNNDWISPFMLMCKNVPHIDIFNLFMIRCNNINSCDKLMRNALYYAIQSPIASEIVIHLLKNGIDYTIIDFEDCTVMSRLLQNRNGLELLNTIYNNVNKYVFANCINIRNVLFDACSFDDLQFVTKLLEFGAIPDDRCIRQTISNWNSNALEIARLLINYGAPLTFSDRANSPIIIMATYKNDINLMSMLLPKVKVNAKDINGNTALMIAVMKGYNEIAKMIIEANINVNLKNHEGDNALSLAIKSKNDEMINVLCNSKASVNVFNVNQMIQTYHPEFMIMNETLRIVMDKSEGKRRRIKN